MTIKIIIVETFRNYFRNKYEQYLCTIEIKRNRFIIYFKIN
jgi:hypothetical protein